MHDVLFVTTDSWLKLVLNKHAVVHVMRDLLCVMHVVLSACVYWTKNVLALSWIYTKNKLAQICLPFYTNGKKHNFNMLFSQKQFV